MSDGERHPPTRLINPLGPRVLVRVIARDDKSKGGLYLPANVKPGTEVAMYGEVVAVARSEEAREATLLEGVNVSGIPDGARVLIAPDAGFSVPWDQELRIVASKEVLAVVEEITPDAVN